MVRLEVISFPQIKHNDHTPAMIPESIAADTDIPLITRFI